MKHRIVGVVALVVIVAAGDRLAAQRGAGQPWSVQRAPSPNAGVIVGRVFDVNTNAPVRRAQVAASNDETFLDATTDDEGRFQLTNVAPGDWQVTVQKGGYFPWHVGQRRPFDIPPPVRVGARQRVSVEVALTRGGAIAGRIADETGEPVAGVVVRAYRARMSQGFRRLEAVGIADRTDDTGSYRIYALPPGDYYIAASWRMAPADSVVETTYAPTYYPGTGDIGEAQRIKLGLGSEVVAPFAVLPVRHVRVSGSLLTSSGAPSDAFVNLVSEKGELGIPLGIGAVTRPDGGFTLPDVPPGRYMLTAATRSNPPYETASVPLIVSSEDITNLSVVTGRSPSIRGRFIADANASQPVPQGVEVTALAARINGTVLAHASDPVFALDDLADPFYLRVNLPAGWAVRAITLDGTDVTDSRITLATGQQADARILITNRLATVHGTVTKGGTPVKADVVIFAADPSKWTFPSRYVRQVETDREGRFRVTGLPPFERYLAAAPDYLEEGEHTDPEFLERLRESAFPFQLEEAETRTLDLPVFER